MGLRIVILASGRGSTFESICHAIKSETIPNSQVLALVCNKPDAPVLEKAKQLKIPYHLIDSSRFIENHKFQREKYEGELLSTVQRIGPDIVCLAGYMLILGKTFLSGFKKPILNSHPSLLPKYPGLRAQKKALESKDSQTGCTIHYVTQDLDAGPIIVQKKILIEKSDTEESLSARLLPLEHTAYIEALQLIVKTQALVQ